MDILTTTPLQDNDDYAVFHDWLWAFNDFAFRHPAHHEVPGNLPFDNISNAPTCIIAYAFMIERLYKGLLLDIAYLNGEERIVSHYDDGSTEIFKGKVLFKYKKAYEAVNGKESFGDAGVPMVPFIGNFMPMPCNSPSVEALRKRVSESEKTLGLFTGYLAHIGNFVDFGLGTNANFEGLYAPYKLFDDNTDEEMKELLEGNDDIKRYFSLFSSYDDFIEKNFLEDFFAESEGSPNEKTLIAFFKGGYSKTAYNEFSTVSREIINSRGSRLISFLMNSDKEFRNKLGIGALGGY